MDEASWLPFQNTSAIIVEEAWRSVSISAEVSARIMEKVFYDLDVPVQRLCGEVPIPCQSSGGSGYSSGK
jgi:pyruvate/2-oxoglutarate/acetoin dehydrogenase E1 component